MSRPYHPWSSDPQPLAADPHHQPGTDARTGSSPSRPDYPAPPPPLQQPSAYPPLAVRSAFWSWLASFSAGLAVVAYSLSKFGELRTVLRATVTAQRPQIGSAALDQVVDTTLRVGLAGTTTLIAVQLVLAALMRARRPWARILLAAIGLLSVLWAVFSLVTVAKPAQVVVLGQAVLIVVATVLMFLPSANAWFRSRPQ